MPELGKYGSVGTLGGNSQGDPASQTPPRSRRVAEHMSLPEALPEATLLRKIGVDLAAESVPQPNSPEKSANCFFNSEAALLSLGGADILVRQCFGQLKCRPHAARAYSGSSNCRRSSRRRRGKFPDAVAEPPQFERPSNIVLVQTGTGIEAFIAGTEPAVR